MNSCSYISRSLMIGLMIGIQSACYAQDEPESSQTIADRLRQMQTAVDVLQMESQAKQLRLRNLDEELNQARGQHEVLISQRTSFLVDLDKASISTDSFAEVMRLLQSQRVQLSIDLAGLEARRESLIALQRETAGEQGEHRQQVIGKLKQLVQIQGNKLNLAKELASSGSASQGEVQELEGKLLEAEIRLSEFESAVTDSAVQQFRGELAATSIERAEKQARLHRVEEMLAQIVESRQSVHQLSELDQRIAHSYALQQELEQQLRATQEQLNELELRKSAHQEMLENAKAKASEK